MELINPNPIVHERKEGALRKVRLNHVVGDGLREPIDSTEIFDHIRDIIDPEHPYTLEQLNVVSEDLIEVDDSKGRIRVRFTPTVAHCSMATLIGLSLRVKLLRCLPSRFKVDIQLGNDMNWDGDPAQASVYGETRVCHSKDWGKDNVTPGTHSSEAAVNKQLGDKERVAAALENPNLLGMVERSLASSTYYQ